MAKPKNSTGPKDSYREKRSVISESQKEIKAQASARRSKELTSDSRHHAKDGVR